MSAGQAGMNRQTEAAQARRHECTRACGDEPCENRSAYPTAVSHCCASFDWGAPAHAGMNHWAGTPGWDSEGLTRACGDEPSGISNAAAISASHPRMRE